jgi:hypothetical protein
MTQETFIVDLLIHTGTDFEQTFVLEDTTSNSLKDLTGFSACCEMRRYEGSTRTAAFTVSFASDRTTGRIEIAMTRFDTINLKPGKYFYDLVLKDASNIKDRVVEGTINVKKAITR